MKIEKIRLAVGLEHPVRIAHLTDIHLCLADERDAHLIDHAKERAQRGRRGFNISPLTRFAGAIPEGEIFVYAPQKSIRFS